MGKLVSDRIPEIIKNDGKTPIIEILSNEDYLKELEMKKNKWDIEEEHNVESRKTNRNKRLAKSMAA